MATIGTSINLVDIINTMAPDGSMAKIAAVLAQTNDIFKEARFQEGNLPTGNQVVRENSKPGGSSYRKLNSGVAKSKATFEPIIDTCCIMERNVEVDVDVLAIQNNQEAYLFAQEAAHIRKMNEEFALGFAYGDTLQNPEQFNGLTPRYNSLTGASKGNAAYQIIGAGGASNVTSLWLVGWGDEGTTIITPKGSPTGLNRQYKGVQRVTDGSGNPYYAECVNLKWKPGLSINNLRYNCRVANIDSAALAGGSPPDLVKYAILAKNRLVSMDGVDLAWYCNETVYSYLEVQLTSKTNVWLTRRELMNEKLPTLFLAGIPVRKVDAITNAESVVS